VTIELRVLLYPVALINTLGTNVPLGRAGIRENREKCTAFPHLPCGPNNQGAAEIH
jgi:hypothetical protein